MTALPTPREALVLGGVAVAYYLALVACARWLRHYRNIQFGRLYHLFAGTAAVMGGLEVAGWRPSWRPELLMDLSALTVLVSTIPLITILNRFLWTRTGADGRRMDAPRLLADTTGLVVIAVLSLVVWHGIYGRAVTTSMLAGSGVVAVVIGFAMQDLLGNILAGFALFFSKPFKVGDWLQVDNQHARVLEVTWRSTRLVTDDDILLEVPNNALVKQTIVNFHRPGLRHALRVTIGLHYNVPPARAQLVLRQAAATVPRVCVEPPPSVQVHQFADSAVVYEVKFWIEDHAAKSRIMSEVRSHCWYAVRRAEMEIPFPTITLHQPGPRDIAAEARAAASAALRNHSIFSFLSAEQVENLVQHSSVELFAPFEPLVEQEAEGNSMFLIVQGTVEVRVRHDGSEKILTRLGPGDCLGEMSMLTGERRSATVLAQSEVEAVEITHGAFSAFVRQNPEVLNRLGDLLVKRQQENITHQTKTSGEAPVVETRDSVMRRLRSFFELGE